MKSKIEFFTDYLEGGSFTIPSEKVDSLMNELINVIVPQGIANNLANVQAVSTSIIEGHGKHLIEWSNDSDSNWVSLAFSFNGSDASFSIKVFHGDGDTLPKAEVTAVLLTTLLIFLYDKIWIHAGNVCIDGDFHDLFEIFLRPYSGDSTWNTF